MPRIAIHVREAIVNRMKRENNQSKTARELGVSRRSVQEVMCKYRAGLGVEDLKKRGRRRKLTVRQERKLARESRKNPKMTANELRFALNLSSSVSVNTVKRSLRRAHLFGRVAVKKPLLTSKQINKRLEWCLKRRNWSQNQWERIVFSDECLLQLHPCRREYVRRGPGEKLKPQMLNKTSKFSPTVMVWGAIRSDGFRILIRCERNVDSFEYQRILDIALPQIMTGRTLFQQDGASCHRSASTRQYLSGKAVRCLEEWPAQSPDLNLIENLWVDLKKAVKDRHPKNVDDLWATAEAEWANIPSAKIDALYKSMCKRVGAVIAAKGRNTNY